MNSRKPLYLFHVMYESGDRIGYILAYFSQFPPLFIFFELFFLMLLILSRYYENISESFKDGTKKSVLWIWPGETNSSLTILLISLFSGQCLCEFIARILKSLIGHTRPLVDTSSSDDYGIPSSHSQFVVFTFYFLVYCYIQLHYRSSRSSHPLYFLLLLASVSTSLVSFSRWYLCYHYIYQIIAGWIVGALLGHVWAKLFIHLIKYYHNTNKSLIS